MLIFSVLPYTLRWCLCQQTTHKPQAVKIAFLWRFLFSTTNQMRNITQASVKAFKDAKKFKSSNTEVYDGGNGYIQFYLFGNLIAQVRHNDELNADVLLVKDAGRRTKTTKERLNGILREFGLGSIYQKGKDANNKTAWFYVDQFGNEEKRDSWKTFELNKN